MAKYEMVFSIHSETYIRGGFTLSLKKEFRFLYKMVLDIFKIALRLRYRHILMWHLLGILSFFNTLNLKQFF